MKFGLTDSEFDSMLEVFARTPAVEKAVLFGSRAKGIYRPGSDVDIAVSGRNIRFDDYLELQIKLDELDILQKIDLVRFESIKNPDFIDHIKRVGIVIFQKSLMDNGVA